MDIMHKNEGKTPKYHQSQLPTAKACGLAGES